MVEEIFNWTGKHQGRKDLIRGKHLGKKDLIGGQH